jgi:hypothetical protein
MCDLDSVHVYSQWGFFPCTKILGGEFWSCWRCFFFHFAKKTWIEKDYWVLIEMLLDLQVLENEAPRCLLRSYQYQTSYLIVHN